MARFRAWKRITLISRWHLVAATSHNQRQKGQTLCSHIGRKERLGSSLKISLILILIFVVLGIELRLFGPTYSPVFFLIFQSFQVFPILIVCLFAVLGIESNSQTSCLSLPEFWIAGVYQDIQLSEEFYRNANLT